MEQLGNSPQEQHYREFVDNSQNLLQAAQTGGERLFQAYRRSRELAAQLAGHLEREEALFLLALKTYPELSWLAVHQVNVAIFAARVTQGLDYERSDLIELTTACLIHDLGMARRPLELVEKTEPYTTEDRALMEVHPIATHDLLHTVPDCLEFTRTVCRAEHERIDGKGYPDRLAEAAIHPFSQLLGLADEYEALTHQRPWRPAKTPFDAMKEVIDDRRGAFNPELIKVFLKQITMFPPGSYVELNTGELARVVSVSPEHPLRPQVRVLADSWGKRAFEPKLISLVDRPILYVKRSVRPEELPADIGANSSTGAGSVPGLAANHGDYKPT